MKNSKALYFSVRHNDGSEWVTVEFKSAEELFSYVHPDQFFIDHDTDVIIYDPGSWEKYFIRNLCALNNYGRLRVNLYDADHHHLGASDFALLVIAAIEARPRVRLQRLAWRKSDFKFRDGPVSGLSRRRRRYRSLRHMKTQQERREAVMCEVELTDYLHVRGRRKAVNLPTCYDDVFRHTTKSWKAHRKTQWKP